MKLLIRGAARLAVMCLRAFAVALIGLTLTAAVNRNATLITVVGLLSGALALLGDFWVSALKASRQTQPDPEDLATQLAAILKAEWTREARTRGLMDKHIMPIAWAGVQDRASDPLDPSDALQIPVQGRVTGDSASVRDILAKHYTSINERRLVILGHPGAGKSALALLLALALTESRKAGEPLPVLLPASAWDPVRQTFRQWIVEWSAQAHYGGRRELIENLVDEGLIFPIVDGLDEVPEPQRRSAMASINQAVKGGSPVLVTCRSIEYNDLIKAGSPTLSRAPVIEVLPVPGRDAVTYLKRVDLVQGHTWDGLAMVLQSTSDVPARAALSTPLMLSLCRLVISRLNIDPDQLVSDPARFESKHSVEDFLTDHVVDAVYAPRAELPATPAVAQPSCSAETARKRLTYIANYLHNHNERDFYWWRMSGRLLSPWTGPGLGIGIGLVTAVAVAGWIAVLGHGENFSIGLSTVILVCFSAGGGAAILSTIVWYAAGQQAPSRINFSLSGASSRLHRGFRTGSVAVALPGTTLLIALLAIILVNDAWTLRNTQLFLEAVACVATTSFAVGLSMAAYHFCSAPPTSAVSASPSELARRDRRATFYCALIAAGVLAVTTLPSLILGVFFGSLLTKFFSSWAGWPARYETVNLAQASLHNVTLGAFGTAWLVIGALVLVPALGLLTLTVLTRAWPRFIMVRVGLLIRREMPWSILSFLDEARDLGVLRSAGVGYQFRHIRLQEHLASAPLPKAAPSFLLRQPVRRTIAVAAAAMAAITCLTVIPDDTARAVITLPHGFHATDAVTNSDGSLIAVFNGQGRAELWNLRNRRRIATHSFRGPVEEPQFYPSDAILTGYTEDYSEEWIWDTTSKQVQEPVASFDASPDGRHIAIEKIIKRRTSVLEVRASISGHPVLTFENGHLIAWHGVGLIVYFPSRNMAEYWDLNTPRKIQEYEFPRTVDAPDIDSVTFVDDYMIMDGYDETLHYWDLATGSLHSLGETRYRSHGTLASGYDDDVLEDRLVTYSYQKAALDQGVSDLRITDPLSGRNLLTSGAPFDGSANSLNISISDDGTWLLAQGESMDGDVNSPPQEYRLFNLRNGSQVANGKAYSVHFVERGEGTWLAIVSPEERRKVAFYALQPLRMERLPTTFPFTPQEYENVPSDLISVYFEEFLLLQHEDLIQAVDAADIALDGTLPSTKGGYNMTATPDGRVLLARTLDSSYSLDFDGDQGFVKLDDMPAATQYEDGLWDEPVYLGDEGNDPNALVGLLPGTFVVVGDDNTTSMVVADSAETVQVWNIRSGDRFDDLVGHRGPIRMIGMLKGRETALTIGADDTIRIWDIA